MLGVYVVRLQEHDFYSVIGEYRISVIFYSVVACIIPVKD